MRWELREQHSRDRIFHGLREVRREVCEDIVDLLLRFLRTICMEREAHVCRYIHKRVAAAVKAVHRRVHLRFRRDVEISGEDHGHLPRLIIGDHAVQDERDSLRLCECADMIKMGMWNPQSNQSYFQIGAEVIRF